MASIIQQTRSSLFSSSLEDRINTLELQTPVSIDDDIWTLNLINGRALKVDFSVFDTRPFLFMKNILIRYDSEPLSISPKTLAKILFVGIQSGVSNQSSTISGGLHSIKMLFYFLTEKNAHTLEASELEPFLCFYLLNDIEGTELKRLISPPGYASRPILNHLRKIRKSLYRHGIDGVMDVFPDSDFNIKMNSACEAMLDMTFNDYQEGGSFNYLGLNVGKHYVDHCHLFFEKHFLFASALEAVFKASPETQWPRKHRHVLAKILFGLTLSDEHGVSSVPLKTKLHYETFLHNIFRQACERNAKLSLLFKLTTISHFVALIGLSDRYDAQEFVRSLLLIDVFGPQGGKTKESIWREYKAAVDAQGEKFSISIDEFELHLLNFVVDNSPSLPIKQESLRKHLYEQTSNLLDVFSLTREAGKNAVLGVCAKVRQSGLVCLLGVTGWRRSEYGFTVDDIKISNNNDGLDNFYTPWRYHINWLVPKTNGMSKTMREITSTSYILLLQLGCLTSKEEASHVCGNTDELYKAVKILWIDFIKNYALFDGEDRNTEENFDAIEKVKYEVRQTLPLYELANGSDDFREVLNSYRRGDIIDEHRKLLEDHLPKSMLDKINSSSIELTTKNVLAVKNALLSNVKYPSPHAFRHIWAEAVLMRYRGPVGSFIRANFQHMDERFFMAYLRDKDMKLISEHAERTFISYISQQYADLGREAFGETVSQLPRFIELSVRKTSVLTQEEYLEKVSAMTDEAVESVKPTPWGTCIRRSGTDFRAACSKGGVPQTHEASPKLCLGCTNVDITKFNLKGIMVYTRQEVEVCLNPNLPQQLKRPYIDMIKMAVSVVNKLKEKSDKPERYNKALEDFETALNAAKN